MINKIKCFFTKHDWLIENSHLKSEGLTIFISGNIYCKCCGKAGDSLSINIVGCTFVEKILEKNKILQNL